MSGKTLNWKPEKSKFKSEMVKYISIFFNVFCKSGLIAKGLRCILLHSTVKFAINVL